MDTIDEISPELLSVKNEQSIVVKTKDSRIVITNSVSYPMPILRDPLMIPKVSETLHQRPAGLARERRFNAFILFFSRMR